MNYKKRNEIMKQLKQKGFTYRAIAERYGISRQRVYQIIERKPRKHRLDICEHYNYAKPCIPCFNVFADSIGL